MYYLKIRDEDGGNTLNYYCRNCGHEDTTLTAETICVSETQLRRSEQKYTHMVNEYTKFDPTLPRINTIKCPNQECSSNGGHSGTMKVSAMHVSAMHVSAMHVSAMHGGVSDTSYIDSDNNKEPVKLYEGGAGTSKAGTSKAAVASKAVASKAAETKRNKTAKTLAKEAAESAKESAKEAIASAKKAETIFKELDKEVEAEEAQSIKKSKSAVAQSKKDGSEREVIYIRYDDINMKYVYLCVHCDTTWKTDNRM